MLARRGDLGNSCNSCRAAEHPDGTLRERMKLWNQQHPRWRYSQVTNFGRDVRAALRRLLGAPEMRWDSLFGDG